MQQITLNDQVLQLPETWQEVESKKLPELLKYLYVLPASGETYHNIIRIIFGYSDFKWKQFVRQFFSKDLQQSQIDSNTEVLGQILNRLSWMWQEDLTVTPFRDFKVNGQSWLVFEPGFKSMSFGEMTDAYIHAQAFVKQLVPGEDRMNLLVASICRPERTGDYKNNPSWNGDPREDYNEHIAARRAELLKGAYVEEKVLVMVYFLGSIKDFFSYFDLFDNDGSAPPALEEFPGQSMIKNQHLLSQKQVFGNMESTKSANVHEVFQFLEEHNKDVKEEIARHQANQN